MEQWIEYKQGLIPKDNYSLAFSLGEEKGLLIDLKGEDNQVVLDFGAVEAVRILEEGLVQTELYSQHQIDRFKKESFSNVVYRLTKGEFEKQIHSISDGYSDILDLQHFVVITQNYNIDILALGEPEIIINEQN